jgi:hypothetical protein
MTEPQKMPPYSSGGLVVFWLLWLLGWGACLPYILGLVFLMQDNAPSVLDVPSILLIEWNLLAVGVQGYLLVQSARFLFRREEHTSELLLRVLMASIGVPLIAYGGCIIILASFA